VTVAAAVIAYQAGDVITQMLDSLVGHVDHVVIGIDPKTTDNTREVIESWRGEGKPEVHVYDGVDATGDAVSDVTEPAWDGDDAPITNRYGFSDARNLSFGKAWAIDGVDWVLWIDTDDVFGSDVPLREFLAKQAPQVSHIFAIYLYHRNEQGDVTTHFDRERIFRRESAPIWKFKIHEVCEVRRPGLGVRTDQMWWDHKNVTEKTDQTRGERNFTVLRRLLEENPNDARSMQYLGHQHFGANQWTEAAEWYEKYLNTPSTEAPIEKWQILIWLARARRSEGDVPASIKAATLALQSHPEFPDAYHELAHSYAMRRSWAKAIEFHEMGLSKTARPPAILVNSPQDYESNPYRIAHTCYYQLSRYSEALDAVTKALEWAPDDKFLKARGAYYLAAWKRAQAIDHGLSLAKHLIATNEPLKARRLLQSLPAAAAEERPEVNDAVSQVNEELAHLQSEEQYENFYLAEQPEKIQPSEELLAQVPQGLPRMEWVAQRLVAHGPGKVLEVGVGNAIEAFHLARAGMQVVGIDIDPKRVKDANLNSVKLGFRPERPAPEHTTIPGFHQHEENCHYVTENDELVRSDTTECGHVEHLHEEWTEDCDVCGPVMMIPDMDATSTVEFHWCEAGKLSPKVAALGPFDYVVASEVIEHVEDAGAFLDFLEGVNGERTPPRIVLTTPDGGWRGHQERNPSHVQVWSRLEFEGLLAPRGVLWNSEVIEHPWGEQPNLGIEYQPGKAALKEFLDRPPVTIFCGAGFEKWSPEQVDRDGLGGSETAVVHVARHLAAQNTRVIVFAEHEGIVDGVRYRSHKKWRPDITTWLLIGWRHPEMFDAPTAANHNWVWLHDVDAGDRITEQTMERVDTILVVSQWHKKHVHDRYPFLKDEQVVVVYNGIDPARFEGLDEERILTRVAYASSPDRGLEQALGYWPRIREIEPEATLEIFYGWDNFDLMGGPQSFKRKIRLLSQQNGVVWRGRLGQKQLAQELAKCSAMWYPGPHPFEETFGITFVEAQAAGCIPVTRDNGALSEVNQYGFVVKNDAAPETWTNTLLEAMRASKHQRQQAMKWARTVTWQAVASRILKRGLDLEKEAQMKETAAAK
jgi:glycosyltransferase involved in cell wall biosynthesis/tetratricopeptide (TPR) repeat protein